MNADRMTDAQVEQYARLGCGGDNTRWSFNDAGMRRTLEAVRSHYEADLRQAREALVIAHSQMAHKLQCFTVRPTTEWNEHGSVSFGGCSCEIKAVRAALAALDARLGDSKKEN